MQSRFVKSGPHLRFLGLIFDRALFNWVHGRTHFPIQFVSLLFIDNFQELALAVASIIIYT